jgi:DNA transposition AAA+ family ATPase
MLLATITNRKFSEIRGEETLELINRIVVELQGAPQLVVIDDATYLSDRSLQNLIHIYNESGSGMILMGTKVLMERMLHPTGRRKEELEQLTSRFGIAAHSYPRELKARDAERIAKAKRHGMTEAQLEIVTAKPRSARQVAQLLKRAEFLHQCNKDVTFTEILKKADEEMFLRRAG